MLLAVVFSVTLGAHIIEAKTDLINGPTIRSRPSYGRYGKYVV